jgi:chromosome segregation ATPase
VPGGRGRCSIASSAVNLRRNEWGSCEAHYAMFKRRPAKANPDRIAVLEARCRDLQERLESSDAKLKAHNERLYELQKHYASEHFSLQESMREAKTERLRNAGLFADREIILSRAEALQSRIADLKSRLRRYEEVDDALFDDAPIVVEAGAQT